MNEFISYLNSVNNVGGNSTGSLAETQVKSKFFDMIKVDRKLGQFIVDGISSGEYHAFILTGHAGDGKTSILVQVLRALGKLPFGEGLEIAKEYPDFFYTKDMSEISEERQIYTLERTLQAPNQNKSSMLISNTGPLLRTFTEMVEKARASRGLVFDENAKIELQSKLLTQLDQNKDEEIEIEGYRFILVNIARVDNVSFPAKILNKVLHMELWKPCDSCTCKARCPILHNREIVFRQIDRVSSFVENFYRYLYENDRRMTIRQMVGQISYALTGNLSCEDIGSKLLKEPFFNYNFANLFFGYYGLDVRKDSRQIKGIEQIQFFDLDRIALDVDYRLFVNHEYSFFLPDFQVELEKLRSKYRKHYQITAEDLVNDNQEQKIEVKLRKAVRRFYLMYSLFTDQNELQALMNQIFGTNYADYLKLISSKQPKQMLKKLQNIVFQALYIKNTGVLPNSENELPLTLRREDDVFQNVMLVLGEVGKNNLEIVQVPVNSRFEDTDTKQELFLRLGNGVFKLTLPMVNYFSDLIAGAIASNNNPNLTHGIAALDALLLDKFGDKPPESADDCELRVIINTTSGQEVKSFAFDGKHLSIL